MQTELFTCSYNFKHSDGLCTKALLPYKEFLSSSGVSSVSATANEGSYSIRVFFYAFILNLEYGLFYDYSIEDLAQIQKIVTQAKKDWLKQLSSFIDDHHKDIRGAA